MRIIKWIKNWFYKEPTEKYKEEIEVEESEQLVLLQFRLKHDMKMEILSSWDYENQNDATAYAFGTMLKFFTNGQYDLLITNGLADALIDNENVDPEFIQKVLLAWKDEEMQKTEQQFNNSPAMSPLRTFGESNLGGIQ